MAAEVFPVARIDEYAKPCEPAIHLLRSLSSSKCRKQAVCVKDYSPTVNDFF